MAVIRLEFEIDSDVHPELHAMLASIASAASRGERMRQLATTALIWERFRVQGQLPYPAQPPAPAAPPPRPRRAPAAVVPDSSPSAASPPRAKRSPGAEVRRPIASGVDFVDLAIDAAPASPPVTASPGFDRQAENVSRHLPVLLDVVDPAHLGAGSLAVVGSDAPPSVPFEAEDPHARTEALAGGFEPDQPAEPARIEAAAAPHDVESPTTDGTGDLASVVVLPQKPATRSRLMRMKEKGLFKNG